MSSVLKPIPRAAYVFADTDDPKGPSATPWEILTQSFPGETRSLPAAAFTLYDTFDGRLARKGLELSVVDSPEDDPARPSGPSGPSRLPAQWRLVSDGDGVVVVEEHTARPGLAADLPSGELRERLEPVTEERRLLPLARLTVGGEERAIFDERLKTVARARRMRVEVEDPESGTRRELPERLVVEGVRGYDDAFEEVRDALAETDAGPWDAPLRESALEVLGRPPRGVSSKISVALTDDLTAGEAARRIYLHLLDTLEAQEDGTRRDLDPEFLHDFRVAVRRTRSGLSRIKKVLPEDRVEHFKEEFRWLGRVSGPTRDLDVFLLLLPGYRRALEPEARVHLDPLEDHLKKRQREEQKKLAKALRGRRYRKLRENWRALLEAPPETGDEAPSRADAPVKKVASRRIRRLYKRMVRDGRALDPQGPAEPFHELRKDGKKLRYLMEFFRDLYPEDEIGERIRELKKLQDVLGTFNDLSVQRESLVTMAREMAEAGNAPPETLLTLGRLAEILRRKQGETRRRFESRFEAFAGKDSRRRMKETFTS